MSRLVKSTGIVAVSTMISRVLGFIRDMLMAKYFGAKRVADVFFIAFMIPNLFRRLVAEGALTVSFIPVYTEYLVKEGEDRAREVAQKTLTIQMLVIFIIVGGGVLFSPQILDIFFARPRAYGLAVDLTRFMFPYLIFVGFVAFAMGVLNSHGYFFAPSFAPVLLNVGMITGIFFFRDLFSEPLYGVALGVILGGALQLILQIPYLIKSGFRMRISLDFNHPGIRTIFRLLVPVIFAMAVNEINVLVQGIFAARIPGEGSVTYIYYTNRLTELVHGVFILSIGNVILPEMSRMSAVEDIARLKNLYASAVSAVLFVAIPASVALMIAGLPIISILFMRGEFTPFNAVMTNSSLFYASMGIVFVAILRITTPTFYSMKDMVRPVIAAAIAVTLNIILSYILMRTVLLHAGLTLASAIAGFVQMCILFIWLQMKIGRLDLRGLFVSILKIVASAAVMAAVIWYIRGMVDWLTAGIWTRVVYCSMIVVQGGGIYLLACYLLGVREVKYFTDRILKRIK